MTASDQYNLAVTLEQQGDTNAAMAAYRRAIELDPDLYLAHYNLANALKSAGHIAEAIDHYHMAIAIKPDFAEALGNLGITFHEARNLVSAVFALNAVVKLTPNDPLAHNALANVLRDQGHFQAAMDSYNRALTLRPNYAAAHNNLGKLLHDLGRIPQAIEHYRQAIANDPERVEPYQNLGMAHEVLGQRTEALAMYREALARGGTAPGARYHMAAATGFDAPDTAPPTHITQLFNNFAENFDIHLGKLEYEIPQLLKKAFTALTSQACLFPVTAAAHKYPLPPASLDIIDLGCGTGLCAPLFKPLAKTLRGIDLSFNMIDKARQRNLYDELITSDILPVLRNRPNSFDLAIAADVLVYLGDLDPLFDATHHALRPDGFFVFSVEVSPDLDFALRPTRRYVHSEAYLRRLAAKYRFQILSLTTETLRQEAHQPVPGFIVVLQR